jgi:hypothetical protein
MSDDDFQDLQDLKPSYTFIGTSPGDELLEVARIHRREVKQLMDSAYAAQAEGREQEAKLLFDIAKERQDRAEEFESAARGEIKDPCVTEILSDQEETTRSLPSRLHRARSSVRSRGSRAENTDPRTKGKRDRSQALAHVGTLCLLQRVPSLFSF